MLSAKSKFWSTKEIILDINNIKMVTVVAGWLVGNITKRIALKGMPGL